MLYVVFPPAETEFIESDSARIRLLLDEDMANAERLIAAAEGVAAGDGELAALLRTDYAALVDTEQTRIIDFWAFYLDHTLALERLIHRHRHFYQINYLKYPTLNRRSFLIAYTSFVVSYRNALVLHDLIGDNPSLQSALDERREEVGIPARAYFLLMQGLTSPDALLHLTAGRANLTFLEQQGDPFSDDEARFVHVAKKHFEEIHVRLGRQPDILVENPLAVYEQATFRLWFPFQQRVSEAMGDLRTARRPSLVTIDQAHEARAMLEPGDIVIERRNWYLSNIGLPGFWPHAALYTGTLEDLDRFFAGSETLGGTSLTDYVRRNHPDVHASFQRLSDGGFPKSVIEAVSEGVTLHSWEESAAGDYVCVLRPRLSKEDRLKAILRAFTFHGRPYDFNFDFATDNALVCSEVVYKAYRSSTGKGGIDFNLGLTAGRPVLAPNSIIRKFDKEWESDTRQLDFVLFFDGSEADRRAIPRTADDLRVSWRRSKWDIVQP